MNIINKIKILFFCFILFCCTSKIKAQENNCYRANTELEVKYSGENNYIAFNFESFNSDTIRSVDIMRLKTMSGYDYSEDFKRLYVEKNKAYLVKNNEKNELLDFDISNLEDYCRNLIGDYSLLACKMDSSLKITYSFFIKVNNQLMMTFYSNRDPKDLELRIIKEQWSYLDLFESVE